MAVATWIASNSNSSATLWAASLAALGPPAAFSAGAAAAASSAAAAAGSEAADAVATAELDAAAASSADAAVGSEAADAVAVSDTDAASNGSELALRSAPACLGCAVSGALGAACSACLPDSFWLGNTTSDSALSEHWSGLSAEASAGPCVGSPGMSMDPWLGFAWPSPVL